MTKRKNQGPEQDYETGYGRPPKKHQFRKGQSGNPCGRPKGSKSLKTVVPRVLSERVRVREGEHTRDLSKLEAMVLALANAAMKGKVEAFSRLEPYANPPGTTDQETHLAASDEDILKNFLDRERRRSDHDGGT